MAASTTSEHLARLRDAGMLSVGAHGRHRYYRITDPGVIRALEALAHLPALRARRRPLIRYCLDWTEQHHHLAGGLGAALASRLFELDWLRRTPTHRAVQLTSTGRTGLAHTFGLSMNHSS